MSINSEIDIFLYDINEIYKNRANKFNYSNLLDVIEYEKLIESDLVESDINDFQYNYKLRSLNKFNDYFYLIFPYYQILLKSKIQLYSINLNPIQNLEYDYILMYYIYLNIISQNIITKTQLNNIIFTNSTNNSELSNNSNLKSIFSSKLLDNAESNINNVITKKLIINNKISNITIIDNLDLNIDNFSNLDIKNKSLDICIIRIINLDSKNIFIFYQYIIIFIDQYLLIGSDLIIYINANILLTEAYINLFFILSIIYDKMYIIPDIFSYNGNSNIYFINKKTYLSDKIKAKLKNNYLKILTYNLIPDKFIQLINNFNERNINILKSYEKLYKSIYNILKLKNSSEIQYRIIKYYENYLIKKCLKLQIKIPNDYFISGYSKQKLSNLIINFFPLKKYNLKITDIKLIDTSAYSVTHVNDSILITNLIIKIIKFNSNKPINQMIIIDATSNIGGNTWSFAEKFKKVIAIEIDYNAYLALKNNMSKMKFSNIEYINEDYTKILDITNSTENYNLNADIIFFDPPWGGKMYSYINNVSLYMSSYELVYIILKTIKLYKTIKYIVCKLPNNYNLNNFQKITSYKTMYQYYITNSKKYQIIILELNNI